MCTRRNSLFQLSEILKKAKCACCKTLETRGEVKNLEEEEEEGEEEDTEDKDWDEEEW